MPTSPWNSITPIINTIMNLSPLPDRILDVGLGFGKYGMLCREYLQFWNSPDQVRKVTIDGIEGHSENIGNLQRSIYDNIHVGEALENLKMLESASYDLILMIDVLEHFDKETGKAVINEINRISTVSIISTPRIFWEQHDSWGNIFETHKSLWSRQDLINTGACHILRDENWIAIYAKEPHRSRFTYKYRLYKSYQYLKHLLGITK